ncbi:hypothetical protein ADU37_CDS09170 [Thermococcus sp. 2319x1]|uniref:hypothetical protein n=1 Tax=Thermococcus sp. 2319x1 TaxID=1674923 RepID=UPI00073AAC67|nr:hypothetical protein [Thermococcus sp. 2319x1]ALV62616.1 hypothetical protein ADU37_CDS09170 [Thermococcus sp. 2319x1]
MRKKTLVLMFVGILAVSLIVSAFTLGDKQNTVEMKVFHMKLPIARDKASVIPDIHSKEELLLFVRENKKRLYSLKDGEVVSATITFSRPLSKEEVLELLGSNVKILAVRYKSYPEGIGQLPYPMEVNESKELMLLEKDLRQNFGEEFKLIEGFISTKVVAPKEELIRISKSRDVFDVNIGPKATLDGYGVKYVTIEDVWWKYEKYILKAENR